jgi:hypothetical protein
MTAFLPGPGKLHVTATTSASAKGVKGLIAAALSRGRIQYTSYSTVAHHRGLIHARLHPTKAAAALVARRRKLPESLPIRVSASFTPTGGHAITHEGTITLKP